MMEATLIGETKMIEAAAQQLDSASLTKCARELEMAAARGDFDGVRRQVGQLRQEIQSLEELAGVTADPQPTT